MCMCQGRGWCDFEKPWRSQSLTGRTGGDAAGPVGSAGVSLSCNVTNALWCDPSTPSPHPLLGWMSEDPGRGTATGKDGDRDRAKSAGHGFFSLYHFNPPPPYFFLVHLFQAAGPLCSSFMTTGLHQDLANTYATCHPDVRAALPGAGLWSEA